MLLNIHVKNFALIDEADIDLKEGLNILTGETGAGKSILIDAVSSALGGRIKGDVIGGNDESAFISLVFSIDDIITKKEIEALDINTEFDSIIISRKILKDRSIFKINDEPVTGSKVKAVTSLLVDIHGQHEHESLLKEDVQLNILDKYADNSELLDECRALFENYKKCKSFLDTFNLDKETLTRKIDYLKFEIEEITNANLTFGEREDIEKKYNKMKHSEAIARDVSTALRFLSDDNENASELLMKAQKSIQDAAVIDKELEGVYKQINDSADIISDLIRDLKTYAEDVEYDPSEFRQIEQRIDELNRLENKYGKDIDEIFKTLDSKKNELLSLENYEYEKEKASNIAEDAYNNFIKVADKLTEVRKTQAKKLSNAIEKTLKGLNFLAVKFDVIFSISTDSPAGRDAIKFVISTNPGEDLKPLAEVSSGGELSRIMLGFKSILSDKDMIHTLIFDEIDAGISGRTAGLVAEKLKIIAKNHQVICITHLPQIAAMADSHYLIDKKVEDGRTKTHIFNLDYDGEIEEIARFLSGEKTTDSAFVAAKDLKRLAKEI